MKQKPKIHLPKSMISDIVKKQTIEIKEYRRRITVKNILNEQYNYNIENFALKPEDDIKLKSYMSTKNAQSKKFFK